MPNRKCNVCKKEKGRGYNMSETRKVKRFILCDSCLARINQIKKAREEAGKKAAEKRKAK